MQGRSFASCIPGMIQEKEEGMMRKTTLKIMIAVGAAAVLMTGCFGKKQAPAAPAETTAAAAAESAAESAAAGDAGTEKKDGAGTDKKDSAAEKKDGAGEEKKDSAAEETKEGTAGEESKASDESGAADETAAGAQEGTNALLKSAASALEKQAKEAWGAYGGANVNVNQARKLLIVSLNRAGLTDEAIRNMSEEDWRELSSKAQQLASQCKGAVDKMGLKDFHVGVELVDSAGGKDYLKIVDGNVDYDVWAQIAGERAAQAVRDAEAALAAAETAAPAVPSEFGPGAGLTAADGKVSERVSAVGAEAPAQQ